MTISLLALFGPLILHDRRRQISRLDKLSAIKSIRMFIAHQYPVILNEVKDLATHKNVTASRLSSRGSKADAAI
jgi:hypothetical protein